MGEDLNSKMSGNCCSLTGCYQSGGFLGCQEGGVCVCVCMLG